MEPSFGQLIRQARKNKGYSQRELAELVHLNFTYLSKLENDRAEHSPSEEVIRALAQHLELPNVEELMYLAGRMPQCDRELLRQNYKVMPELFRKLREDPEFAQETLRRTDTQIEGEN
jgi:HTH-type transcriptional regulator, competence development regulator